jgi:hypothetical protein
MTTVHYATEHGTVGSGLVADMQDSPLSGKCMLLIVDFAAEAKDPEAGKWIESSKCWEPESEGPQNLACFL